MQEQKMKETVVEMPIIEPVKLDSSRNNMFAWLMAFVPIIGTIIGAMIGFGYACLALNIILCYIDESSLKKQGVNTEEFGEMTFLVPYYLYKRAKTLGDGMGYFMVWCILFALTLFI